MIQYALETQVRVHFQNIKKNQLASVAFAPSQTSLNELEARITTEINSIKD